MNHTIEILSRGIAVYTQLEAECAKELDFARATQMKEYTPTYIKLMRDKLHYHDCISTPKQATIALSMIKERL